MIIYENERENEGFPHLFWLNTAHTSYIFGISPYGHPEHIYYGPRLESQSVAALRYKRTAAMGAAVLYEPNDSQYCLDHLCLEWSGIGLGDYRFSPMEIKQQDGSFTNDFIYSGHKITTGSPQADELPTARDEGAATLEIILTDGAAGLSLSLFYTVFEACDVIARHCTLTNHGRPAGHEAGSPHGASGNDFGNSSGNEAGHSSGNEVSNSSGNEVSRSSGNEAGHSSGNEAGHSSGNEAGRSSGNEVSHSSGNDAGHSSGAITPPVIRKLMSMMVDLPDKDYRLITFDGDWISEAHRHDRRLMPGLYVNSSTTGASSNRHNPGFLLAETAADEDRGTVYGFNLIYSGNHFGGVERSPHGLVRIALGINPHCFEWVLGPGEHFTTPQAVMTCAGDGFNQLSRQFHDFINHHIVPEYWQGRERPVLYNSWEAHFFKFNQHKLVKTARQAQSLGIELFVLDDGWFGARNNDHAGLGDYTVNRRKFPRGLPAFARKIRRLGLEFGLWFEPEMVNEDSDLFRRHPEWAVRTPGRRPTCGRNQLVLDLCNPAVRDYIVASVGAILDETKAAYVKWDMNRHISDTGSPLLTEPGEFFHRYILGLYEILKRIFGPRPHILLESCSSGGNRFDLGMLTFGPQVWTSDCTDPIERLAIQGGLSYLYPTSTFGAHVSDAPHQQTLRPTPLSTRFNAACFGCLGYELELKYLTLMERAEIREQIAFYKAHRATLQFGRFHRKHYGRERVQWQCTGADRQQAVVGFFQTLARANPENDRLEIADLPERTQFQVTGRPQRVFIRRFGSLIKHVLPFSLNPGGWLIGLLNRVYALPDCAERYVGDGLLLRQGIRLNNQFMGTNYTPETRLLGDFGSNLYLVTATDSRQRAN